MTVVLDASIAIGLASSYRASPLDTADRVLVPDLYVEEVVNAVWKNHQFMGMDLPECESIIDEALNFPNVFVPGAQLAKEAFALAAAANHPAYDMFYLALARREAAVLLTNDKALRRLAQRHGIQSV